MKAANSTAEKAAVETVPNREELPQDGGRHFFWRLGPQREPHRASHAGGLCRVRHLPRLARPASSLS